LEQLSDYLLLSADNFNEVIALLNAPQPLPEDKEKRLKELQALAAEKEKSFRDLQAKVNRTPQEDEAYKSMCDQFDAGRMRLADQEAKLSADYRQQIAAARDEFMKTVLNVTESLARAEGYGLVLDASVVLYGGTDITDKVLAKLNAK
jgi:Skp family chaperone for outer membrane proteins